MIKKPEQIIQEQMNPSQSRGGFGGLLDYARERNENYWVKQDAKLCRRT